MTIKFYYYFPPYAGGVDVCLDFGIDILGHRVVGHKIKILVEGEDRVVLDMSRSIGVDNKSCIGGNTIGR